MTAYLIAFNGEWLPALTDEDVSEASKRVSALRAEMKAAGVLIFMGGLDDASAVFRVDASSGTLLFTDGPYVETKEHLGGFAVVDVADEDAARCGQEGSRWPAVGRRRCGVSRFQRPGCRLLDEVAGASLAPARLHDRSRAGPTRTSGFAAGRPMISSVPGVMVAPLATPSPAEARDTSTAYRSRPRDSAPHPGADLTWVMAAAVPNQTRAEPAPT
ncbi:YciI family protein [Terrabacter sp. 2RAF25]|uniref:YciI family protein n=1 Tax=Terrabacter sp. 2RAF25 TaxID=3232998 RepID=UPI003F97F3C8